MMVVGEVKGERNYKKKEKKSRGTGSRQLGSVGCAEGRVGCRRPQGFDGGAKGGQTSVPVRVTLINHILSAGCVED